MKKYLFLSLFLILAAAFMGCEAVYENPPASLAPPPPAPAPQPQTPPFIVIDDPDWDSNQQASAGYNMPQGMYGQPMMQGQGQVMMTPQGQQMMIAPGQQQMVYPQGQPMMMAPGQQQMVYPQGQPMMMAPGQQQMVYPQGQPMMMAPGQEPYMMNGDDAEPPNVIYEVPGGPGGQPTIYPEGSFNPQDMMIQGNQGEVEYAD